jgi:hypothetical protein
VRAECFSIDLFADCFSFPFGFSASPGVGSFRLLVCVYFHVSPSPYPARVMFSQNHPLYRSNVYVGTYTIEAVLWKKHVSSFINDVIVD